MSEKIIEIRKPTQKQTITAIKSGDFSEVEKIEDAARQEAAKVFLAVASGAVPLIWYDLSPIRCQSGAVSSPAPGSRPGERIRLAKSIYKPCALTT